MSLKSWKFFENHENRWIFLYYLGKMVRAGAGIFDKLEHEPHKNGPAPQHCIHILSLWQIWINKFHKPVHEQKTPKKKAYHIRMRELQPRRGLRQGSDPDPKLFVKTDLTCRKVWFQLHIYELIFSWESEELRTKALTSGLFLSRQKSRTKMPSICLWDEEMGKKFQHAFFASANQKA
jgi:hypothetical protein